MSAIRPELAKAFRKWADVIWLGAVALVALWVMSRPSSSTWLQLLMGMLALGAGVLSLLAYRQLRLRVASEFAKGHVDLDERQVTYYFRGEGWSISLDDLTELSLQTQSEVAAWVLRDQFGTVLKIPMVAGGADDLLDELMALGYLDSSAVHFLSQKREDATEVIWKKS